MLGGKLGAVIVFAGIALAGAASATPVISGCTKLFDYPNGNGAVTVSQLTAGTCVLAQDKLFKGFTNGVNNQNKLPAGLLVSFNLDNVGGEDIHTIAFSNNGASHFTANTTYKWGFEVEVFPIFVGGPSIVDVAEDFSQSPRPNNTSILTNVITVEGTSDIRTLTESRTGAGAGMGTIETFYSPGVTDLLFQETLVDKGTISSVEYTIVEDTPEPASLLILGGALAGFGALRRKRKT